MASPNVTDYHHSVRNYRSPFKMEHRNATAFPDPRSPAERHRMEAAERQLEVLQTYREATEAANASRVEAAQNLMRDRRTPKAAVPGMMPNLMDSANADSDHFWGAALSPSRMTAARAETMLSSTARTGHQGPIPAHDETLTLGESRAAWSEMKFLRFGVHKRKSIPYVGRDEYVDPIRCTDPRRRTTVGYVSRPTKGTMARFGAVREESAVTSRRTPAHALELADKPNHQRPFATHDDENAADRSVASPPVSHPTRRLPATQLLTEVDERLRLKGLGTLLDIRFASDEAISSLMQNLGFSPTQRMTILWELRKLYPTSDRTPVSM